MELSSVFRKQVDVQPKDWGRFARQAAEFHVKNAEGWVNRAVGTDLTRQIDPDFVMGPG